MHRARTTQLGPYRLRVLTDSIECAARWTNLLAGLGNAALSGPELEVTMLRTAEGFTSSVDGDVVCVGPDTFEHEIAVTRRLNERKLDAEPQLLHLHSAAVSTAGVAALVVGRSGDGKSTLTARLVERGWRYVTDEQVTIRPDDRMVLPYARPITLRRAVWHLFDRMEGSPGPGESRRVEVPLAAFGGVAERSPVQPALVIAPHYRPDGDNVCRPVESRAEVVRLLASCCYDLERTGAPGMDILVGLAATCPAWRLEFSDVDRAADAVAGVLAATESVASTGHRAVPADAPAGVRSATAFRPLRRAPQVSVWQFDDGSGIAFDLARLRLTNLDAIGVAVWELLGSTGSAAELIAAAPDPAVGDAVEQWIEVLLQTGFIERFARGTGRLSA